MTNDNIIKPQRRNLKIWKFGNLEMW